MAGRCCCGWIASMPCAACRTHIHSCCVEPSAILNPPVTLQCLFSSLVNTLLQHSSQQSQHPVMRCRGALCVALSLYPTNCPTCDHLARFARQRQEQPEAARRKPRASSQQQQPAAASSAAEVRSARSQETRTRPRGDRFETPYGALNDRSGGSFASPSVQ